MNPAGTDDAALWLNGVQVASATGLSLTTGFLYGWRVGMLGFEASREMIVDDIALNDTTGINDTGLSLDSKIGYLLPTGINANTGGWVGGAGGAASVGAVDNLPPIGLAPGSATDASQLKDTAGNPSSFSSTSTCSLPARSDSPRDRV